MGNLGPFTAVDGVDPQKVPKRRVYTGPNPWVGKTYGSDRFSTERLPKPSGCDRGWLPPY